MKPTTAVEVLPYFMNSSSTCNVLAQSNLRIKFRRMLLAVACIVCLLSTVPMHAQWTQVWGGNFPGAAGTTYNHNNWWNNVQPNNPWGDGTQQKTSDSLQNAYVDGNGNLVIALTYTPGAAYPYTSARLTSKYAAGPYGRFDTRIQNPSVQGAGAAFWSLGADAYPAATSPATANPSTNGGVPWPYCGELDMMEIQAATSNHNGSTIHGSNYGADDYVSATVNLPSPQTFDNGFHVFTTQWAPFHLQFFLDNSSTPYGDIDLADTAFNDTWELNQPINVILSSGIGGNGGTPGTTGFPSNMTVSYVNYSQWSSGAPGPVTSLTATASHSNAVNLSWSASSTSGVTYDIYASTSPNTPTSIATVIAQNISATNYQHTGLQPNTTYYYTVMAANFGGESSAATATATTQAPGNSTGMQLSAGGWAVGTYMNSSFVVGGNSNAHLHVPINTSQITSTPAPQQVYDSERWGAAAWTITGLTPGAGYNVNLHFVETTHTGANQRAFNVSINSQNVLNNFDIFAAANGMNTAINRPFYTQADANGIIELQTQLGTSTVSGIDENPTVSAIEITPANGSNPVGAAPGTIANLAINSGGAATGSFLADEDFNGGDVGAAVTTAIGTNGVTNPAPQNVYQTSRIAPFTYVLTGLEANATYNLRLHFAETFFTSANQRLFNIAVNGVPFLNNFDIYAKAGGANQAVVEQTSVNADQYGQIIVQLLQGAANTPQINGIEAVLSQSAIGAPSNLTASAGTGVINLAWSASSTSGAKYTIYRAAAGSSATAIQTGLSGTTYSDTAVVSGTSYSYYVVATSGSGTSAASNAATATVGGGPVCTIPGVPGALSASASSTSQIGLNWTASSSSCTQTYTVYRSTSSGFTASSANQVGTSSGTTYTDTGLTGSTTYFYLVTATDSAGTSAPSNQASALTQGGGCTSNCGTDVAAIDAASTAAVGSFSADTDFTGGGTYAPGQPVTVPAGLANAAPAAVYQTARQGAFTYTIPGLVAGSSYTVRLHFAELYFSAAAQRQFNVSINNTPVLSNFDIFATAGNKNFTAVVQTFSNIIANASGQIVIAFSNGAKDQPMVNGLEVLAAAAPPASTSIDSGSTSAVGSFVSDTDFTGGGTYAPGQTVTVPAGLANAAPAAVYQTARQGAFTYTIPGFTPNSTGHSVTLHFAELYFSAAGQRMFNASINGNTVLTNFDIFATAGNKNFTAVTETFPNLTANASGQIVITFANGLKDQPMLNGILAQ